jgi:Arc/MetJ-type ribon-helix-helix transcriptional regulator
MRSIAIALLGLSVVLAVASVLGDEACDASDASSSSGDKNCAPKKDDGSHDAITGADEMIGRPIWWEYSIDQLFQDYFDCGTVIYGYDGDSDDNSDDDFVDNLDERAEKGRYTRNSDVVSEAQLQKLRHQWGMLREKYVREVNLVPIFHEAENDSTTEAREGDFDFEERTRTHGVSAIVVPSRIGDAGPTKGRGVFATAPIPKDSLIINLDSGSTGIFKVGHSWREFAVSLPREVACNFIEWSWVQMLLPTSETDDDIRNGLSIFIAFDETNLMNNADWDGEEANTRCGSPPKHQGDEWGPCRFHYYAARDIAAGEELLLHYGDFEEISQRGWVDIGL